MSVGRGGLDIDGIAWAVKPAEAQRAAFDELPALAAKAEEAVEMVESRLDAMLAPVRIPRPALSGLLQLAEQGAEEALRCRRSCQEPRRRTLRACMRVSGPGGIYQHSSASAL